MRKFTLSFLALATTLLSALLLASRSAGSDTADVPQGNGVYFWRTSLSLDSAEIAFLRDNNVKRMYVRFFDVVRAEDNSGVQPNATISFPRGNVIPEDVEYVPVVFILPECLSRGVPELLAGHIVRRIKDMAAAHDLPEPKELQIDCDWTPSVREAFMQLMEQLYSETHKSGMKLSATIRLHQLSQAPPAADYGVLMVYNTGDVRRPAKGNPILSREAVDPYLRYLGDYKLPLITALPNFRWPVLYKPVAGGGEEFAGILYGCRPEAQPSVFRPDGESTWLALSSELFSTALGNRENVVRVVPGMRLRVFSPPALNELLEIKSELSHARPGVLGSILLYDLNSEDLSIYKGKYEKVFAD